MEKIISLFKRDYKGTHLVYNEVVPGAEWVLAGEGVATEKLDGTAMLIRSGAFYRRYDAKKGKTPPPDFEPAQEPDPITGHWPGWVPIKASNPNDQWALAAFDQRDDRYWEDGTYELLGPKVQGNPYNLPMHRLERHGTHVLKDVPRDYAGLKAFFKNDWRYEGIVWWHPDGRMVKIKRRDFGLKWPV